MTQIRQWPTTPVSRFTDAEIRFRRVDNHRYALAIEAFLYYENLQRMPHPEVIKVAEEAGIVTTTPIGQLPHTKEYFLEALYHKKREEYNLPDLEEHTQDLHGISNWLFKQIPMEE